MEIDRTHAPKNSRFQAGGESEFRDFLAHVPQSSQPETDLTCAYTWGLRVREGERARALDRKENLDEWRESFRRLSDFTIRH